MRELKFRVWNKDDKKYIPPSHIAINGNGVLLITYSGMYLDFENEHYTHLSQKYIIQQYTGLKDKNGTDIYEGDIIKLFNGQIHKVEFIEESNEIQMSGYCFSSFGSEIIGDIFENPEL